VTLMWQFQTNAPKSCFMRPNSGVLAPKETLIATGNPECSIAISQTFLNEVSTLS